MDQYTPYLKWIKDHKAALLTQLKEWVSIHSGSDNEEGLAEMLVSLRDAFAFLDGKIEEVNLPPQEALTAQGQMKQNNLGKALSITKRPDAPVRIFLGGHMDIARSAELPLEPFAMKDSNTLVARGSADMKGGLLVMLTALHALEDSPFAEKIGWHVFINPDEEIGSPGSQGMLRELAKTCQLGLIFEPSLPDGTLASSRKGSANFSIAVRGVSAHAGRDFHRGKNAISSVARIALAAEKLNDYEKEICINIGAISGGGPVNIVPDHAFLRLNLRVKNADDMKSTIDKLFKIIDIENNRPGIHAIMYQDSERPPKPFDKTTRSYFESLKRSAITLGMKIDWKSTGGVCDGNILSAAGLPTIDTLGAIGGNLHTAEEYVLVSSIVQRSQLVARFLMQIGAEEIVLKP